MKPLSTNKKVLNLLGILKIDENANKREKILQITTSVGMIMFELFILISSVVFIYKNVSTNLEVCLYAIFQTVGCTGQIYMMISALIQRSKIAEMFKTLSNLYSESKNSNILLKWIFLITQIQTQNSIISNL